MYFPSITFWVNVVNLTDDKVDKLAAKRSKIIAMIYVLGSFRR